MNREGRYLGRGGGVELVDNLELLDEAEERRVHLDGVVAAVPDVQEVVVTQHAVLDVAVLRRHDGRQHLSEPLRVDHDDVVEVRVGVVYNSSPGMENLRRFLQLRPSVTLFHNLRILRTRHLSLSHPQLSLSHSL